MFIFRHDLCVSISTPIRELMSDYVLYYWINLFTITVLSARHKIAMLIFKEHQLQIIMIIKTQLTTTTTSMQQQLNPDNIQSSADK